MPRWFRSPILPALALVAVLAAAALAFHFFPVIDWASDARKFVESRGLSAALLYALGYAVCNMLLLPGGVLGLAGGFFFGLWWGFATVLVGNVLGAAGAMAMSRWIFRGFVRRKIAHRPQLAALDRAIAREGGKIVVLSQLHPLFPTSLLNYLYGITRLPFWKCLGWVLLGQAPGLFFYSYLGTLGQLGLNLARGDSNPTPKEYVLWGAGLLTSLVLTIWLGRIALRLLKASRTPGTDSSPPKKGRTGSAMSRS